MANERQDFELMNIFAQIFSELLNKFGYDEGKNIDELSFNKSFLCTFSIYNEDFKDVFTVIFRILSKFES